MKTILLEKPGEFQFVETSSPEHVGAGEALVRVLYVGICGTDFHAFEGTQPFFDYPRILGHELAVEILELGESDSNHGLSVGDICAVEPYLNCGECISCRRGYTNACVNMRVLGVHMDGGMREQIIVPIRKLHHANSVPPQHLAIVEMLSIGAHAVRRAHLSSDDTVLVIGAGPIGLGTMAFAKMTGANVIAMDVNTERLSFCRSNLQIKHTVDARENPVEAVKAITGDMPTAVFDATGSKASMMKAFEYVAHSGRLIYVGLVKDDIAFSDPYFHSHEMTLMASRNATGEDFKNVIDALSTGKIAVDAWITHHATPEQLLVDFPSWLKPETGVIKALLSF